MVPGFQHHPGNHCGSTALRNLLAFHGTEITEDLAFGLGAGACFYYLTISDAKPTRWFNGRTARLEENFAALTGSTLRLTTEENPDAAWARARDTVDSGQPILLLTDLYYLDHYGKSAHFPGHAIVLAGYDDETAYVSDTGFEELQKTSIASLHEARHGNHPAFALDGHAFTVADVPTRDDLLEAVPAAIEQAAQAMLEPEWGEFAGIPAVRRLAAEAPRWPQDAEDWQWCARFGYQVIERRGTGGGNFRLMYSRFLAEVGRAAEAELALGASEDWTALAEAFHAASESDEPETELWEKVGECAGACLEAEERLWQSLA
jgi:hypothetical protein